MFFGVSAGFWGVIGCQRLVDESLDSVLSRIQTIVP